MSPFIDWFNKQSRAVQAMILTHFEESLRYKGDNYFSNTMRRGHLREIRKICKENGYNAFRAVVRASRPSKEPC